MSAEEAKAVVKRYWDHGVKRAIKGEAGALKDHLAEHCVIHTQAHHRHGKGGADDHHDAITETVKAIPDLTYKVERYVAEGDTVVAHWRLFGQHGGHHKHRLADEHVAPTQANMEVGGITIYRVENGKIAEMWSHDDHLDALIAAGAIKLAG